MEEKGYFLDNKTIVINREMTELDLFLKKFLEVIKKYSSYLVVSGFVSISSGRTRGTEDIDVLIPMPEKEEFCEMFNDLIKNGFWCYQSEGYESAYEYVERLESIRFAKKDEMFPNIEFIPINETKKAKFLEFSHPQKIKINKFEFLIPPIEFEIMYKETALGSEKDIDDAKHLREFFSDIIDESKLKEYKKVIQEE
jgi:hypothetical protein